MESLYFCEFPQDLHVPKIFLTFFIFQPTLLLIFVDFSNSKQDRLGSNKLGQYYSVWGQPRYYFILLFYFLLIFLFYSILIYSISFHFILCIFLFYFIFSVFYFYFFILSYLRLGYVFNFVYFILFNSFIWFDLISFCVVH